MTANRVILIINSLRPHLVDAAETNMADRVDRKVNDDQVEIAGDSKV